MPIFQGLYVPVYLLPSLWLALHSHQLPPGLDIFGYHSALISMWLPPVPVHPCPVQKHSWRPQRRRGGGGGGALQGSAQPEMQGSGEKFLKPGLQSSSVSQLVETPNSITLVKALHCKVKNGKGNSDNSLFTCMNCDVLNSALSVELAVLLHLVFLKRWKHHQWRWERWLWRRRWQTSRINDETVNSPEGGLQLMDSISEDPFRIIHHAGNCR